MSSTCRTAASSSSAVPATGVASDRRGQAAGIREREVAGRPAGSGILRAEETLALAARIPPGSDKADGGSGSRMKVPARLQVWVQSCSTSNGLQYQGKKLY